MRRGETRKVFEMVSPILIRAINLMAEKYPEPTRKNTLHPNTWRLLDIRDLYLEKEQDKRARKFMSALLKLLIVKYEDPFYGRRLDWALGIIMKSGWKPCSQGYPNIDWRL